MDVAIKGDGAVGFGGTGEVQGVVTGDAVVGVASIVIGDGDDHRCVGRSGIDSPVTDGGWRRLVASGVGGGDGKRVTAIGENAGGDCVGAIRLNGGGTH